MATTISTFLNLPNDLLRRILVGVPLEDHRATASVCRGFRDVINGPKFLALRQTYGFAERGVVLLQVFPYGFGGKLVHACVHNGQIFAFMKDGEVYKMVPGSLNDRSGPRWSPGFGSVGVDGMALHDFVSESVILG